MINVISHIEGDQIKIGVTINGPAEIVTDEFVSLFRAMYEHSDTDALNAMLEIKNFYRRF